ncbi:conserved hypothetical protein [Candidatus Phytoplasma mali]|uniref:Sequence-variable mosaic (SVM) signal sequence domain-containing protein n=1 Tax=Phytoplasma mali (strain AT) TaxID=482235 RepID=B3R0L2_PHYMT|nr:SVM family protein [Candidatus Phytoplasma mali]CAP18376.1 conserved hypothetical protein [Candidatus Phytoplasma mali]
MFKFKSQIKVIYICLFIILGLFFIINNNHVMASPPKKDSNKGKSIDKSVSSKRETVSIREYRELEMALNQLPEEERNTIMETLNNPEKMEVLLKKAQDEANKKRGGSSSSQHDDNNKDKGKK